MKVVSSTQLNTWYQTPLGKRLAAHEMQVLQQALPMYCGHSGLILGGILAHFSILQERIHAWVGAVSENPVPVQSSIVYMQSRLGQLPLPQDSMDFILLPHTLAFELRPQAVLEAAVGALAPHGYLVILGFNPYSLWRLAGDLKLGAVPNCKRYLSMGEVKRFLCAANCDITTAQTVFFAWPNAKTPLEDETEVFLDALGRFCWPNAGASYMIVAQKQVVPMTPIFKRPAVKPSPVLLGKNAMGNTHHRK